LRMNLALLGRVAAGGERAPGSRRDRRAVAHSGWGFQASSLLAAQRRRGRRPRRGRQAGREQRRRSMSVSAFAERAASADAALKAYMSRTSSDCEACLGDLLTDLMEWTESVYISMTWLDACAKSAHVGSPFLLRSFLSRSRTRTSWSTSRAIHLSPRPKHEQCRQRPADCYRPVCRLHLA
jgi:hypothetical protein